MAEIDVKNNYTLPAGDHAFESGNILYAEDVKKLAEVVRDSANAQNTKTAIEQINKDLAARGVGLYFDESKKTLHMAYEDETLSDGIAVVTEADVNPITEQLEYLKQTVETDFVYTKSIVCMGELNVGENDEIRIKQDGIRFYGNDGVEGSLNAEQLVCPRIDTNSVSANEICVGNDDKV